VLAGRDRPTVGASRLPRQRGDLPERRLRGIQTPGSRAVPTSRICAGSGGMQVKSRTRLVVLGIGCRSGSPWRGPVAAMLRCARAAQPDRSRCRVERHPCGLMNAVSEDGRLRYDSSAPHTAIPQAAGALDASAAGAGRGARGRLTAQQTRFSAPALVDEKSRLRTGEGQRCKFRLEHLAPDPLAMVLSNRCTASHRPLPASASTVPRDSITGCHGFACAMCKAASARAPDGRPVFSIGPCLRSRPCQ